MKKKGVKLRTGPTNRYQNRKKVPTLRAIISINMTYYKNIMRYNMVCKVFIYMNLSLFFKNK